MPVGSAGTAIDRTTLRLADVHDGDLAGVGIGHEQGLAVFRCDDRGGPEIRRGFSG